VIEVAIDPEVAAAFPSYRALILVADGLANGPTDAASDALLRAAEGAASLAPFERVAGAPTAPLEGAAGAPTLPLERAADHPHVAAWRAAFSAFGAKPSRFPSSVEALLARVLKGQELPRVNRLVDLYNAISVLHVVPVGGEDLDRIEPPMRLVRAQGDEPFDVREAEAVEHPRPGEVVWRDARGVTCRRWNWRQGRRTALTEATTRALFVFDRLEPMSLPQLDAAADDLDGHLQAWWPGARTARLPLGGSR
jgi:DNA/RNA-binding domain of Phe-tRNA-synthetase-like protein